MKISIDLETYSSVDIKSCGMYKYMESPDFEILLIAYSIDGSSVEVIDLASGEKVPETLKNALYAPDTTIHGWNVIFERAGLSKLFGREIPLSSCRDTMLSALYCGYPASLDGAGAALGLEQDKRKMAVGKALIKLFCTPTKPTASNGQRTRTYPRHESEKWELFKEYNRQDVVTEMAIADALAAFPVPASVQAQWVLDAQINERGVAVCHELVDGAKKISAEESGRLLAEARQITGLENPNSIAQLSNWLRSHGVTAFDALDKEAVSSLLAKGVTDKDAERMLCIRQLLGKSSIKKYEAMTNCACVDGRVRGLFQFYGANRTGRFAGRLVQVQNLPRNYIEPIEIARDIAIEGDIEKLSAFYDNVPDTISQLIRTAFIPSPGHKFIVTDFSAIEARVLAWMAGEQWVMDVFATTGKIYEATAAQMFGVHADRIKKGNPEYDLRQRGKVAQLACGYQGGAGAMERMDIKHVINPDQYPELVERWRNANPNIVKYWYTCQNAAINAMKYREAFKAGPVTFQHEDDGKRDYLTALLPSSRKLFYPRPFLTKNRWGGESMGFWGQNQTTKKWEKQETYGGRIVENLCQAIARDCLVIAMKRLEDADFPVVMHIHDEVVLDCPQDKTLEEANEIMAKPLPWASDLLLKGAGFENTFYMKD